MTKISLKFIVCLICLIFFGAFSGFFCRQIKAESEYTGFLTAGGNVNNKTTDNLMAVIMVPSGIAPAPGTYGQPQNIILVKPAGALNVRYTFDGGLPDCSGAGLVYANPIPVNFSLTIKAISCYPDGNASPVNSFPYAIATKTRIIIVGGDGGGGGGGGSAPSGVNVLAVQAQKIDVNKDNKIDVLDFNGLMVGWGVIPAAGAAVAVDFSGDGKVDILDFNMLMVNWTG